MILIIPRNRDNMTISSFSWLGIASNDFYKDVELIQSTIGIHLTHIQDHSQHALFRLYSGQDLELFGSRSRWYSFQTRPVLGFETTKITDTQMTMEQQGIKFISPVVNAPGWGQFCYFIGPDGINYELVQRTAFSSGSHIQTIADFEGFSWAGLISPNFDATIHLFAQVCGFDILELNLYHALFILRSGQTLEVFHLSQAERVYPLEVASICVGLDTRNFNTVCQRMHLTDIVADYSSTSDGSRFVYFLGPGKVPFRLQPCK